MDKNIKLTKADLHIPESAYRPVVRCPSCQSIYIENNKCEACGRSLLYHPIGEPLSSKSFYGLKARYVESFSDFVVFYPVLENPQSLAAQSYVRNLAKRFSDLLASFNDPNMSKKFEERKLFYIECKEIIDELLRYSFSADDIISLLENNDSSLIGTELIQHTLHSAKEITPLKNAWKSFLDFHLWGVLRVEFVLKALLISATFLKVAVEFRYFISWQFGK
jgi:uncharacterized protein YdaL